MVGLKNLATLAAALLLPTAVSASSLFTSDQAVPLSSSDLKDQYLITFRPEISDDDVTQHLSFAQEVHTRSLSNLPRRSASIYSGLRHSFNISTFRSYSGSFSHSAISEIEAHPSVLAVEPIQQVHIWDTPSSSSDIEVQTLAPWGLGALSINSDITNELYPYETYLYTNHEEEESTWVYVVDTGILTTHTEFRESAASSSYRTSRAHQGPNFAPGYAGSNSSSTDDNGHGTHVSGTIAGLTYGVSKTSQLVAVKVLDSAGSGTTESILQGLQWVYSHASSDANRAAKSVINMSLGGPGTSAALNAVISSLYDAGIPVVVAAGNDNAAASDYFPANAPDAFVVGSVETTRHRSWFSNFGSEVDVFAPGGNVLSCGIKNNKSWSYKSGTSMATPHVAGLMAWLRGTETGLETAESVYNKVKQLSLKGVVSDARGSANKLAFNGVDADGSIFEELNGE